MLQPLLLTLLGAFGTGLGGILVVLQPQMNYKRLGALQGLAAGLMLSISLIDLLPEAAEEIGFIPAQLCFYAGVLFFATIVAFIPEPDAMFAAEQPAQGPQQPLLSGPASVKHRNSDQLGFSAGLQGVAAQDATASRQAEQKGLQDAGEQPGAAANAVSDARLQAAMRVRRRSNTTPAAARLDTSCPGYAPTLTLQQQQQQCQQPPSPRSPASTCSTSTDLQVVLNEDDSSNGKEDAHRHKQQLLMSGLITAVGIALHNFPEGIAVMLAAQKSTAVGVSLACAIALHNIPEGVAVALPVYYATGSRWRGLQTAVLSGLAEPLAVVLLGLVLPFMQLNKHVVDGMLAAVGGIMAFLAFHELLPLSMQHAGKPLAVGCLFAGMGLMSVTLHYLNTHVLADLH